MHLRNLVLLIITSIILSACDSGDNQNRMQTCQWYESVEGKFQLAETTACEKVVYPSQLNGDYQYINGITYRVDRVTSHYSCGFYQTCQSQTTSYYKIDDDLDFEVLTEGYSKSRNYVYYKGLALKDANSMTFEVVAPDYGKDKNQVYYQGSIIETANPTSFEVIDIPYSKDENAVFFEDVIVEEADPSTFVLHKNTLYQKHWHHDDQSFYYINQKIKMPLNIESLQYRMSNSQYSTLYTDDKNIVLASYTMDPSKSAYTLWREDECHLSDMFEEDCLRDYALFKQFKQENDYIVQPDGKEIPALGLRYIQDVEMPLYPLNPSVLVDKKGQLIYFDRNKNLTIDSSFQGKTLTTIPISCNLPEVYPLILRCDDQSNSKSVSFFEDDQSIYFVAIGHSSDEILGIREILPKSDSPTYAFIIDNNLYYIIQDDRLYRIAFDYYQENNNQLDDLDGLKVTPLKIIGKLQGPFKGYNNAERYFADELSVIDARTLTRKFESDNAGLLRASDKEGGQATILENDHYIFYLYPATNREKSSLVIHKGDVSVRYLSDWETDLTKSVNIEFLKYLGLDTTQLGQDREDRSP